MKIIVAACQQPLHEPLSEETKKQLVDAGVNFVSLPEHYPLPFEIQNIEQAASLYEDRKRYLAELSNEIKAVLIGGTLTEKSKDGYFNTCYVFEDGKELGSYRKVYPTPEERDAGIERGDEFKIFEIQSIRVGVLICADVLNPRAIEEMTSLDSDIIFIPTASPFRPGESPEEKFERDHTIFLKSAQKMECTVVKTCGVGTTFGHPIQGRSLIATPERILTRAEPHQEDQQLLLIAELNI